LSKITDKEIFVELETLRANTTDRGYRLSDEALAVIKAARENGKPVPWQALCDFLLDKQLIPRAFKLETLRKKYQEATK
jgi:hypothetical protein